MVICVHAESRWAELMCSSAAQHETIPGVLYGLCAEDCRLAYRKLRQHGLFLVVIGLVGIVIKHR